MNKTLRNMALVALAAAPFSAFADIAGSGTAADPYQIATAEDLCSAYKLTKSGETVYFVQTADIDMSGIAAYTPVVGYDAATYDRPLNYDGYNHVIKNFAPTTDEFAVGSMFNYGQTIFGVFSGELKNLGIVDININGGTNGRAGAISGYLGQSNAGVAVTKVSNVYVTGTVKGGAANYTGGLFGTTGTDVEISNCFVNINMDGQTGGLNGAFAGRINNTTKISNCYVAGTVSGNANLVCAANTGATTLDGFVIFNTGSSTVGFTSATDYTMANSDATAKQNGIDAVKAWSAFSATEDIDGYPALLYALSGEGTEASPYIIDSAEALRNAHRYTKAGETVYFVQTADIDMTEDSEGYITFAGSDNATFNCIINYDGKNHIIDGFMPNVEAWDGTNAYCSSLFGVVSGTIKNLGVTNADIYSNQSVGTAILAAYAGHSSGAPMIVDNVFVQGYATEEGNTYVGGMFGTNGNTVTITNSYVQADIYGSEFAGAFIGRFDATQTSIENCYATGYVQGNNIGLIAGVRKGTDITIKNVIAFNSGANAAFSATVTGGDAVKIATVDTKNALIAEIQGWDAFNSKKIYNGYPALNWQDAAVSGIFDIAVDEAEADAPAVYYNLQGVQVANPENGIYIVRRGNKVTKELVK